MRHFEHLSQEVTQIRTSRRVAVEHRRMGLFVPSVSRLAFAIKTQN